MWANYRFIQYYKAVWSKVNKISFDCSYSIWYAILIFASICSSHLSLESKTIPKSFILSTLSIPVSDTVYSLAYSIHLPDETLSHLLPATCSLDRRARYLFYCMFCFVCLFCSVNDFSTTRGPIHANVCMRAYCGSGCVFSPFGG